jgi:hypothetical protein
MHFVEIMTIILYLEATTRSLGKLLLLLLVLDPHVGAGEAVEEHHSRELQQHPRDEHDEADEEDYQGGQRLPAGVGRLDGVIPRAAACSAESAIVVCSSEPSHAGNSTARCVTRAGRDGSAGQDD